MIAMATFLHSLKVPVHVYRLFWFWMLLTIVVPQHSLQLVEEGRERERERERKSEREGERVREREGGELERLQAFQTKLL